jgi:hypothetical protein
MSVTKDEDQQTRIWQSSIRDTAKSEMGCIGNRCLSDLVESDAVNVGGSSRNAKSSSRTMYVRSVGATIVVGVRESRIHGEGSQFVGIS